MGEKGGKKKKKKEGIRRKRKKGCWTKRPRSSAGTVERTGIVERAGTPRHGERHSAGFGSRRCRHGQPGPRGDALHPGLSRAAGRGAVSGIGVPALQGLDEAGARGAELKALPPN